MVAIRGFGHVERDDDADWVERCMTVFDGTKHSDA